MSFIVPPCNYGMVEYDLSRSGIVHQLNFPFLERLQLKTVIYLSPTDPSQAFLNFLEEQGIELIRTCGIDSSSNATSGVMSEAEVLFALQVILSPEYYPLHVMCKLGRHMTGTVIGCLRKLQRWNLTAIFEEYRRYAGSKVRILNEQFIELFDTDLVQIPDNHPSWL
ncbi:hypothetical protein O6H91_09G086700 [Diphasiastrum complanatum]|uniref:Uncharacterized protein n=1 Tax=Diphasiastrum complanatum TaxID=34168 RepID=A0ACC2CRH7_DIPCM|nr:hypothetical protein O6H91_Y059200 [Diphasiastrum complanatum]KAJ7544631.1 hypothetical protein O6H91_09G086700 [Diphasiastrum complanatum]